MLWNEPLRLVHHHPGRIRARATIFVDAPDDHPALRAAHATAASQAGFTCWSHNPKTGSIVVDYEPAKIEPDDLLEKIARSAGFRSVELADGQAIRREHLVDIILETVRDINKVAREATQGRADLREMVPGFLGVVSCIALVRDLQRGWSWIIPRWDTALWWAQSLFIQWHREEIAMKTRPIIAPSGAGGGMQ